MTLAVATPAVAEPIASTTTTVPAPTTEPAPPAPRHEPTAADVKGAPLPGQESGRTDPGDDGDSTLRTIGRDALFLPKLVVDAGLTPVRAGVWLYDRYQLDELWYRVFFNRDRTIGLYPTVAYESGYGVNGITAGGRFVARDLLGEHEHLAIAAATGTGIYRQLYSLELRSGDRLGKRFHLELDAGYEQRPQDPFYGIGNGDFGGRPDMPIDARVDDLAYGTHYRQQRERLALAGDTRLVSDLHLRAAAAVSQVSFGASDSGVSTDTVYDTMGLVGWRGIQYGYSELELRWDDRHSPSPFEPRAIFASGSLAAAFAGYERMFEGGSDFWRYGADLQHFIRIAEGPRVLALRLHGEGVTGSRDAVPFLELPRLGGWTYLRGYELDRFRDRVAAFGSAEYQWDLAQQVSASLFVDAGRVYDSLGALSLDHLRMGYGAALEGHTNGSFVLQASLASSIDGGIFLNLAFNPVFDIDERVRRR
ncbi:MAG: BamA/TamA family outer membrane protein [Acidobacteriota bacterium]